MNKLKKGWKGIVFIGIITSMFLSYVLVAYIYKFASKTNSELVDILMNPMNVYHYIINDENLKIIIPFIPLLLVSIVLYLLRKNIFDLKYNDASDFGIKGSAKWGIPNLVYNGKILSNKGKFNNKDFKTGLNMEEGIVVGKIPQKSKTLIIPENTSLDNKNVFVSGSSG